MFLEDVLDRAYQRKFGLCYLCSSPTLRLHEKEIIVQMTLALLDLPVGEHLLIGIMLSAPSDRLAKELVSAFGSLRVHLHQQFRDLLTIAIPGDWNHPPA